MQARLLLEDGTLFTGKSFGSEGESVGEVVFNTGMTGYQEVLSDPSYCGQIVTMTYPLQGNYGVIRDDFESVRPFIHGFVVREHEEIPSNWRAQYTLGSLLKEYGIVGISGIDTRMLTRKIRHYGVMKSIITTSNKSVEELMATLKNTPLMTDQVSRVSTKSVFGAPGHKERIVLVDFGAKSGIIRDLSKRDCDVVVVPQNATAEQIRRLAPDGVLLSNGPGDPKDVPHAVEMIKGLLGDIPLFGICLGHQLFALACGADTDKLKFGHRGGNHPVKDLISGRCYITSQNHGYTVKEDSVQGTNLEVTHINNNDRTIEGLRHKQYPAFSVQYHPEAAPGPFDSSYLFDDFISLIRQHKLDNPQQPRQAQMLAQWNASTASTSVKEELQYAKNNTLKKILVIGSGPIVIGQAAEFDYAGTQACQALKEEGMEVILINSNPATIMTDTNMADKVYIEPITLEFVTQIIRQERPDGLLPTLGGQTGLNMAVELARAGVLESENVKLLGTQLTAIEKAEDRDLFRDLMRELEQPVPDSVIVTTVAQAVDFANEIGFPIIIRPAYTLGGTGGGICNTMEELVEIVASGIRYSPIGQCLVERSIAGMKEVEYEVMRDANDNCIVVCNMENFDPVGVHTGDSIVVAPSQTLSDREYQMLRSASLKIIRALNIEGGCNVQYALDPHSFQYYVIEVNPRVSRSSALASKATGYPIAKMAAKIAIGYTLDELVNPVTGQTYACFEPALDYIVSKIPRWPFDKFTAANRKLGTQMKATGEVMAIGRTFEESIQKAVRSLEIGVHRLFLKETDLLDKETLELRLQKPDDERLFLLAEAFRRGYTVEQLQNLTKIDWWFLNKVSALIAYEAEIAAKDLTAELIFEIKRKGFTDRAVAEIRTLAGCSTFTKEADVRTFRLQNNIKPVYKMVDTCAAEFEASTPYYYSTYEQEDEVTETTKEKVVVLGSGPIRIGQGIEFDYSTVHAVWAIQAAGYEAVIINNNPETVSTDFNTSDRLYFEPLFFEDVMNVIEREQPIGVIVQFGGQTAINLAAPLHKAGVRILGSDLESIDTAEDRKKFEALLSKISVAQPPGGTVTSVDQAVGTAAKFGYPVIVRPSYVLGGRAMEIVYSDEELLSYMEYAVKINPEHPVLIDRYMLGKEVEVDAICDRETVLIPGIMEHVERAGVHSGDSIAVYPPQSISDEIKQQIIEITTKIGLELNVVGLVNIQFVIHNDQVYVIEVNPRSSRTVPFLSKVTNIPMANVATRVIMGQTLADMGYQGGLWPEDKYVSVKVPVFSFAKLRRVDTTLGPEMKSTGEVMGRDVNFAKALYKGLIGAGMKIPAAGSVVVTVADKDKDEAIEILKGFYRLGYKIIATGGTAEAIAQAGLPVTTVNKLSEGSPNILDLIRSGDAQFVVNTLTKGKTPERDGFRIRREAVENGVVCMTSLDTVRALVNMLEAINFSSRAMPIHA